MKRMHLLLAILAAMFLIAVPAIAAAPVFNDEGPPVLAAVQVTPVSIDSTRVGNAEAIVAPTYNTVINSVPIALAVAFFLTAAVLILYNYGSKALKRRTLRHPRDQCTSRVGAQQRTQPMRV